MSEKTYEVITGVVFLLIAVGHLLRIAFGVPVMVSSVAVPMLPSVLAVIVMGFLAYEGFHLARRPGTKA